MPIASTGSAQPAPESNAKQPTPNENLSPAPTATPTPTPTATPTANGLPPGIINGEKVQCLSTNISNSKWSKTTLSKSIHLSKLRLSFTFICSS